MITLPAWLILAVLFAVWPFLWPLFLIIGILVIFAEITML